MRPDPCHCDTWWGAEGILHNIIRVDTILTITEHMMLPDSMHQKITQELKSMPKSPLLMDYSLIMIIK